MSVAPNVDIERTREYPAYGYAIIDTATLRTIAGSLTRDYIYAIKLLSDIVDKNNITSLRVVPLRENDYNYMIEYMKKYE